MTVKKVRYHMSW